MKRVAVLGVLSLSMAMAGAASASPTTGAAKATVGKSGVRVVAGAKMLSLAEKMDVTGKGDCCGCSCTPPPLPQDEKPGYGFGTTGHYGPPGQGFNPSSEGGPTWRG